MKLLCSKFKVIKVVRHIITVLVIKTQFIRSRGWDKFTGGRRDTCASAGGWRGGGHQQVQKI